MAGLDTFHRAVASTLASKRIGTPLFVRYLLQTPVAAKAAPNVQKWLEGQTIVKEVVVPGRLVNFVVRQ